MNKLPLADVCEDEGLTLSSPSKKSLSFVLRDDYIPVSASKAPIDQSQYIEKTACKIICEKYIEPVTSVVPPKVTPKSGHSIQKPSLKENCLDQSEAPVSTCNWRRDLTNLIPQDNYISSGNQSSSRKSSMLTKEEQSWFSRPSNEGILTTGRTKADSGADFFGLEYSNSRWNESRASIEHKKNNIPIKNLIAAALGASDFQIQQSDEKKPLNTQNEVAESYCVIPNQIPEFETDQNLKRNYQSDFKKLHEKIQSQRRFTFDETLRGEPPSQCNDKMGARMTLAFTKNHTNVTPQKNNDFIKQYLNRPTQTLNLKVTEIGQSQEPTTDISNNYNLKFRNKDGQLIDFQSCSSPIRSKKHAQEKQFLFDEAPGSDEDSDSEFSIQDEVEPQEGVATVSQILKDKILENHSEGSSKDSFLIQDQSSDEDAFLGMFQNLNSISDVQEIQEVLGQIQQTLEKQVEDLNQTQIVTNSHQIQLDHKCDSEIKPKIEGIFQLRDMMLK